MTPNDELAQSLKPGDEIVTTIGNRYVVGEVHAEDGWWVEPYGADDYTWWIPVCNIVAVNGRDVRTGAAAPNPPISPA